MEPCGWLGSRGGGDFESVKEAKRFAGSKPLRGSEWLGVLCGVPCGVPCSLCGSGVRGESSSGSRGVLVLVFGRISSQSPLSSCVLGGGSCFGVFSFLLFVSGGVVGW